MVVQRRTVWIGAGVLVVLVIVIAMWGSGDGATATTGPARRPARDQATKGASSDEGPVEVVNLAALKNERGEPIDAGRNPFLFQNRRVPEADPEGPPPGMRPAQPPPAPGNVGPPKPGPPPGPPPPPPLPPIPLKLFGIAEQGGRKVAMLTDGRDPEAGKEGTIVYGQYLILKIGQESVEMAYADGRGRTTIRLTGQ